RRRDPRRRLAGRDRFWLRTVQHDQTDGCAASPAGLGRVVRAGQADRSRPPEHRICRRRPGRRPRGHSSAWLALRHPQLHRCGAAPGVGGVPGDCAVPARLRHDALSLERYAPECPAVGCGHGHHRPDGCAEGREGDHRRIRLGSADGRRHGRALARTLQGDRRLSGYLITSLKANLRPLPPAAEYGWWYQYYFPTEPRRLGYSENRHDFNKLIWKIASPTWNFDDATFERSAESFNNPDHVSIVIHNYRWRLSLADGERKYDALEQKLSEGPVISVPAITIGSDFGGPAADGAAYAKKFSGRHSHRALRGIGHTVPKEAPEDFAKAVIEVDGYVR